MIRKFTAVPNTKSLVQSFSRAIAGMLIGRPGFRRCGGSVLRDEHGDRRSLHHGVADAAKEAFDAALAAVPMTMRSQPRLARISAGDRPASCPSAGGRAPCSALRLQAAPFRPAPSSPRRAARFRRRCPGRTASPHGRTRARRSRPARRWNALDGALWRRERSVVGNQDLGAPHEASRPFYRGVGVRFLFDCSTNCFGLNNGMVAMDRRYCVRLDV